MKVKANVAKKALKWSLINEEQYRELKSSEKNIDNFSLNKSNYKINTHYKNLIKNNSPLLLKGATSGSSGAYGY